VMNVKTWEMWNCFCFAFHHY